MKTIYRYFWFNEFVAQFIWNFIKRTFHNISSYQATILQIQKTHPKNQFYTPQKFNTNFEHTIYKIPTKFNQNSIIGRIQPTLEHSEIALLQYGVR